MNPKPKPIKEPLAKPLREVEFVHIPKTAGIALANALRIDSRHIPALQRSAQDPERWERVTTFSVVRNPWDRAVSQWLYFHVQGHGKKPQRWPIRGGKLLEFPDWAEEVLSGNHPLRDFYVPGQWWYVADEGGKCMVDFLFQFENLDFVYKFLYLHIFGDKPKESVLPKANVTRYCLPGERRPYWNYYQDRQDIIDLVGLADIEVIEAFGYEFGQPTPRERQ